MMSSKVYITSLVVLLTLMAMAEGKVLLTCVHDLCLLLNAFVLLSAPAGSNPRVCSCRKEPKKH